MKTQYELTFKEYKAGQAAVVRKRPQLYVLLIGVVVFLSLNAWSRQPNMSIKNLVSNVFLYGSIYIGFLFLVFFTSVKKSWAEAVRVGLRTNLELNSQEILIEKNLLTVRAKKDFYKKSFELRDVFVLYLFPSVVQIVPKRAFANETDLEQFRAWASGIGQKDAPPIAPIPQP